MKKIVLFCYCVLFSVLFVTAQKLDDAANSALVTQLETLSEKQLRENIYIHTDKDIYEPGEDIWFKAYVLQANTLHFSKLTEVLYLQLIKETPNGEEIVTQETYDVKNGVASGYLYLANIIPDGNYSLRLHTAQTVNSWSERNCTTKNIQITTHIIPKILIDAEFSKLNYDRDELVSVATAVFSRNRTPYPNVLVTATLYNGSKKLHKMKAKTNQNGAVVFSFPETKSSKANTIQFRVKHQKQTENHTVIIPFRRPNNIQFGMYPEGGNLVENLPNTVAFKAVDHQGIPLKVKGNLYENGKKIKSFSSVHYGMGKFNFIPKPDKKYTVRLSNVRLDSVFELPEIKSSGVRMQVDRRNKKFVHFSVTKSEDAAVEKAYIRAQYRGFVYWMATTELSKPRTRFILPLEKFPQGIVEVTLFDEEFNPLAERLVYANLKQQLNLKLTKLSKKTFSQKEKVTMTFSVTDKFQKPVAANLSLSIYDHMYNEANNDYNAQTHYNLFSELKGHVYNASYYFDKKNTNRGKHLDLLMLTQGWRTYVWNENTMYKGSNPITFSDEIQGKVFLKNTNGSLQNAGNSNVKVILPQSVETLQTDAAGNIKFTPEILKVGRGFQLTFLVDDPENQILKVSNPFETLTSLTEHRTLIYPKTDLISESKKQSSYQSKFSFTDTNYLDEVTLTSYKDRKRNGNSRTAFKASSGDYICYEYGILNCRNHSSGPKPIHGKTYRTNSGTLVVYKGNASEKSKTATGFYIMKGMYPEKTYYTPIYDTQDNKMFPDNRKTLFWAPNLQSDTNGKVTVTFYTSDVQSTFLGELEGTDGKGLIGSYQFEFKVTKNALR